jgi:hypothetical protein
VDEGFHWSGIVGPFLVLLAVAVALAVYLRRDARGFKKAKESARERELDFLGSSLPPDLPATLLDVLPDTLEVSNCYSGYRRGERVVSFDYGAGRGKHPLTAVAVKRHSTEMPVSVPEKFAMHQVGVWVLLYTPVAVGFKVGQELVEELWNGLHTVSVEQGEALQRGVRSESGLHIAPRHGK